MKDCWTAGDLRAYLDCELPASDRDRVAAHLSTCGDCELLYREISARAERVAGALGALDGGVLAARPRTTVPPAILWPRWAAAVAMDNEPIDAGLVVRVSLGPDNVQADVIITAGGRARAYRLVNDQPMN